MIGATLAHAPVLNSEESPGPRSRADEASVLDALGVASAEASLFHVIHYGITVQPDDLPKWAAHENYSIGVQCTAEDCQAALISCLRKDWLQVINESTLIKIADELREGKILGPVYGFPATGEVDFTTTGAELWHKINDRCFARRNSFAYHDIVHEKSACYFVSHHAAVAELETINTQDAVVAVSGPHQVGPWRAQWWRRFFEGFRLDIEERRKWQGHSSGFAESCHFTFSQPSEEDAQRLHPILNYYNVTVAAVSYTHLTLPTTSRV